MKSILITGATSGIGNHLIKILANSDYKIYFIGRNKLKCEKLVEELRNKYSYKAEYFLCDFSDLSSVKTACNKILKSLKKIDVLVNNAGKVYFSYGKTHDNFERCFQINYLSHFTP
jgi:short-subunit dehydrogenase